MTRAEQHRQAVRRVYRSLKRTPRLSSPPTGTNRPVWRWPSLNAIAIPGANWPHPFVMKTRAPIRWKGLFWDMHHNWNTEKASNLNESVFTTHKLKTTFPNERYHFHPISNKKKIRRNHVCQQGGVGSALLRDASLEICSYTCLDRGLESKYGQPAAHSSGYSFTSRNSSMNSLTRNQPTISTFKLLFIVLDKLTRKHYESVTFANAFLRLFLDWLRLKASVSVLIDENQSRCGIPSRYSSLIWMNVLSLQSWENCTIHPLLEWHSLVYCYVLLWHNFNFSLCFSVFLSVVIPLEFLVYCSRWPINYLRSFID